METYYYGRKLILTESCIDSQVTHIFALTSDFDFQSPTSYGHDPFKKIKVNSQLIQKWKQTDGHDRLQYLAH